MVAVVALVAVEALPVKAPTNVVAVNVELDGLNVRLVLTYSVVIVPLVALVKAK